MRRLMWMEENEEGIITFYPASIETVNILRENSVQYNWASYSSRIKQLLMISINYGMNLEQNIPRTKLLSKSIKEAAINLGVLSSTVYDKIRQCNISAAQFETILFEFHNNGNSDLIALLEDNVGRNNYEADKSGINVMKINKKDVD